MLTTQWQPLNTTWQGMEKLREEMNRVFGRLGPMVHAGSASGSPALDLRQDEDNLYVEAELPGMDLNDLEIYVSGDDQLELKGARRAPELKDASWQRRERVFGEFTRELELPHAVDAEKVFASMKNGVLTITLPKVESKKSRRIEIQSD